MVCEAMWRTSSSVFATLTPPLCPVPRVYLGFDHPGVSPGVFLDAVGRALPPPRERGGFPRGNRHANYFSSILFAWYSWTFIAAPSGMGRKWDKPPRDLFRDRFKGGGAGFTSPVLPGKIESRKRSRVMSHFLPMQTERR